MKRHIIALLLIISFSVTNAQTRFAGYLYTVQTGFKEKFEYSAVTIFSDGVYKTIYRIFKPGSSTNRYTITASHLKDEKKVIVEVKDERYLLSAMNGKEETTYDSPSLRLFGFRGNLAVFDKSAPNQLAVKFISSNFSYVKVSSFLGSYSDNTFQFFVFNQSDKIIEARTSNIENSKKGNTQSGPKAVFKGVNPEEDSVKSNSGWFTGTRKFCGEGDYWYYLVNISDKSITLISYPGTKNDHYKNKSQALYKINGYIQGNKIITNDPPEYRAPRFKYENGILYELNSEGGYNDYKECE
ncbi:hypothetical protein A4H97_33570 [Niastella yeongjuensis]|uniref:Uncharacterized protein n=1 Tax=Niastella yeongjuensis TaxID=354355 RepID=A0A1V9EDL9_9BACT|nr:hypothetical protein [Niastella yeongjuensis]OQP44182.1 hypothetical protein A4H97_33570 [Niastella yeongjuensis]SEP22295.1 hypothetical protein SAMN05660816_04845 [Niastella yeongjuensis]